MEIKTRFALISKIYCIMWVRRDVLKVWAYSIDTYCCYLSEIIHHYCYDNPIKNGFGQKERQIKTKLFTRKKENRGGLNRRRRDRDYNEAARENHFPTVLSKNFVLIYSKRAENIDVDEKLKGIRTINNKSFLLPFQTFYSLLYLIYNYFC